MNRWPVERPSRETTLSRELSPLLLDQRHQYRREDQVKMRARRPRVLSRPIATVNVPTNRPHADPALFRPSGRSVLVTRSSRASNDGTTHPVAPSRGIEGATVTKLRGTPADRACIASTVSAMTV